MWSDKELLGYLRDFGQEVAIGAAAGVLGMLRSQYVDVGNIESYRPTLLCRSVDVADVKHGTAVVAAVGQEFTVVNVQPRDDGYTLLVLQEDS